MIDYEHENTKDGKLTWHQFEYCIRRNFGGMYLEGSTPFQMFKEKLMGKMNMSFDTVSYTRKMNSI